MKVVTYLARIVVADVVERRARCKDDTIVRVVHGFFVGALRKPHGIGEREDDRARVDRGHELDDILVEDAADGRKPKEGRGFHVIDDVGQLGDWTSSVILASKV
jgi:hypothetical protein